MHIRININCGNQAFENDPNAELSKILEQLAFRLDELEYGAPLFDRVLRDTNGNIVGNFKVIG